MSLILWITLLSYLAVAMVFNLAMLSFYREDKNNPNSSWSGSEVCDKNWYGNRQYDLARLYWLWVL